MGSRIYKMDPAQGFAAQGGGAAVLLTASHLGFPLSTTHSITGAVTYGVSRIFGEGALGPLLVSVSLIMLIAAMFGNRLRHGPPVAPRADAA